MTFYKNLVQYLYSMKYKIDVVTRLQDDGAGGYTMYIYNNKEEMLSDHPMAVDGKLTQKLVKEILNEEDPYINGYIGTDTIEIEIVNGKAQLVSPLSFHSGQ